jgi:hypothetical protein
MPVSQMRTQAQQWWNDPNSVRATSLNGALLHVYVEDPELVGQSPRELVQDGVIAVYFGVHGHRSRFKRESKSFASKDG